MTTERQQKDTNKNNKKNKNKHRVIKENPFIDRFDELWNRYPKKDGRKDALKHYNATVRSEDAFNNISKALGNYVEYVKGTEKVFIKNGSTWFNNWSDWVNWEDKSASSYDNVKMM